MFHRRFFAAIACVGAVAALGALPATGGAATRTVQLRVVDLFSMIHSKAGAIQDTNVFWSYHHTASQPCSLTYSTRVRETVDMSAPVHPPAILTLSSPGGPASSIWLPAQITKTRKTTLDPLSYQYMTPGCPFGSGGGDTPVSQGGCGTVPGRVHMFVQWADGVLRIWGRFVSPLGNRLFMYCRPNVPPQVEGGVLMPTRWLLPASKVFGNDFAFESDTSADTGTLGWTSRRWAVPNAQASTVSAIWMFLRRWR